MLIIAKDYNGYEQQKYEHLSKNCENF